jgi:hypothetical protein
MVGNLWKTNEKFLEFGGSLSLAYMPGSALNTIIK